MASNENDNVQANKDVNGDGGEYSLKTPPRRINLRNRVVNGTPEKPGSGTETRASSNDAAKSEVQSDPERGCGDGVENSEQAQFADATEEPCLQPVITRAPRRGVQQDAATSEVQAASGEEEPLTKHPCSPMPNCTIAQFAGCDDMTPTLTAPANAALRNLPSVPSPMTSGIIQNPKPTPMKELPPDMNAFGSLAPAKSTVALTRAQVQEQLNAAENLATATNNNNNNNDFNLPGSDDVDVLQQSAKSSESLERNEKYLQSADANGCHELSGTETKVSRSRFL